MTLVAEEGVSAPRNQSPGGRAGPPSKPHPLPTPWAEQLGRGLFSGNTDLIWGETAGNMAIPTGRAARAWTGILKVTSNCAIAVGVRGASSKLHY